eukprot:scaffold283729_cov33-Tisochrysis_lutea.AAC.2
MKPSRNCSMLTCVRDCNAPLLVASNLEFETCSGSIATSTGMEVESSHLTFDDSGNAEARSMSF